jgi:hypothetical protein
MHLVLLKPKARPYVFLIDDATYKSETAVVILRLTSIERDIFGNKRQNRTIAYQDIALGFNDLDNFRAALSLVILGAEDTTADVESAENDIWRLTRHSLGVIMTLDTDWAQSYVELPIADAKALVGDIASVGAAAETYIERGLPEPTVLEEKCGSLHAILRSRANAFLSGTT